MFDTIMALVLAFVALPLLLSLGLLYLLTRQIAPYRPLQTFLVLLIATPIAPPFGLFFALVWAVRRQRRATSRRRRSAVPMTSGLNRQWGSLVADAAAAADRYRAAIAPAKDGPLRDSLVEAAAEVDQAVAEASRLAMQGYRTERAHRDVLAALNAQRRRNRPAARLPLDLEESLQAATRAQHESAERLAASAHHDRCQLELLAARLHELAGHALELTTASTSISATDLSIADRVAALRLATAELDATTTA